MVPFCARGGKGAGALRRVLLDVDGHGGSGVVVLQAAKNRGASTARVFQCPKREAVGIGRMWGCGIGWVEWCMVIAGLANE